MRLWNISNEKLDGMYDGIPYSFQPKEKIDFYDKVIGAHLLMKLGLYGVIEIPEKEIDEQEIEKYELSGLRMRRKTLDDRVRNWRTMNKEREAAKLSPEPPSDLMIQTIKEIKQIDDRLAELLREDNDLVNSYLNQQESKDAEQKMNELNMQISGDSLTHALTGLTTLATPKKGRPRKDAVHATQNQN